MSEQLKATLRRPLSAILLILLLGAVSFGFVSRTVEYLVVTRAIEETSKYYKSIGYLETEDYDNEDVTEGAKLIANSGMVAINNALRECDGRLDEIYNAFLDGTGSVLAGSNTTEGLFWGKLTEKYFYSADPQKNIKKDTYTLRFYVTERLYGYPEYIPENMHLTVYYSPSEQDSSFSKVFDELQVGTTYGVKANYDYTRGMVLRQAVLDEMWFLSEDDTALADKLVKEDAVQEINRHKVQVLSTKDMSAMPFTQESLRDGYLIEGRWLTAEDHEKSNLVCVIQQDFAEIRELSVGDTLKITIPDERLKWLDYPIGTTLEDLPEDMVTREFKIVGIYNRKIYENNYSTAESLEVYVPDSCIPAHYDRENLNFEVGSIIKGLYSFVLKSPDLEEEFVRQYRDQLESMGFTLHMIENGWAGFKAAAEPIRQATAYSATMFLVAQFLTLLMTAFLYFRQHRREFAIARALGIPARKIILQHIVPVILLGILGIGTGSCIGWKYSLRQVQKTLFAFVNNEKNVTMDLTVLILIVLIILSFMILLSAVVVAFILLSHYSVLEILHGVQNNQHFSKHDETTVESAENNAGILGKKTVTTRNFRNEEENRVNENIPKNHRIGVRHFVKNHLCRSKGNSILVITLSVVFLVTLGWILQSINDTECSIDELYKNIVIDAEIMQKHLTFTQEPGYIADTVIDAVADTGFVRECRLVLPMKGAYLSDTQGKDSVFGFTLCGITDAEILNRKNSPGVSSSVETDGKGKITYLDGWDSSVFSRTAKEAEESPIVVSEAILERFHVKPGDILLLEVGYQKVSVKIVGSYTGKFTNVGNIPGSIVLIPLSIMKTFYDETLYYSNAEFTLNPEKNHELSVFRESVQQIVESDSQSLSDVNFRIWDEELRMTAEPMEQNLRLMKILFPIAQLVAMLAGGMVSLLLLLQNAKTAAILRVLGIPAKTVRRMLGAEKLLLGIAGSAAGIVLCAILGKWNMALLVSAALYLLGLLIGTVIGCAAVTRKKPLELLQVKE